MSRSSRAPSTLFVLERGGRLPSRAPTGPGQPLLIVQRPTESDADLVERTAARLSDLDERGDTIDFALLACSESESEARADLAEVLVEHLSGRGARLVLTAEHAGGHLRDELVALADHALTNLRANGGTVSLWFDDGCPA
jgi:hypothetical protein